MSSLYRSGVGWYARGMNPSIAVCCTRHRFPAEISRPCVWLYFRFALSYHDVEEMMAIRGMDVSYETIRQWCQKFGQVYANELRRRRPRPGDKWHLDEVFLSINGTRHYLWRAVDQDGNVLDILVPPRRDPRAVKRFVRKLLKGLQSVPRVIITAKLTSYGAAKKAILPGVEHRQQKGRNNRAENAHHPPPQRERIMRRFKSAGHAQRFLAAFGPIYAHSRPRRRGVTAEAYRQERQRRVAIWNAVTGRLAAA